MPYAPQGRSEGGPPCPTTAANGLICPGEETAILGLQGTLDRSRMPLKDGQRVAFPVPQPQRIVICPGEETAIPGLQGAKDS